MSAQQGRGRTRRTAPAAPVAGAPSARQIEEAIASERAIADEAAQIRQRARNLTGAATLDSALYMELWPLLRRPIPPGFIVTTPAVTGKPYESTGIKSLQVQIDRMDNVLTPLAWEWETIYAEDGRLAHVIVFVGPRAHPLVRREARGGVNQASTVGNQYKGSETNAAKLALARVGPGHEVYVGATDLDPDVSPEAAEQQHAVQAPPLQRVSARDAAALRDKFDRVARELPDKTRALKLKLGSLGVSGLGSVNQALASLTPAQAEAVDRWLDDEASRTNGAHEAANGRAPSDVVRAAEDRS